MKKTLLAIPYYHQRTYYTCGPAALKMALAFFRKRISEKKLAQKMHTSKAWGTTHRSMIRAAQNAGFFVYVNERATMEELQFLIAWKHSIIVDYVEPSANIDHYAVISGMTAQHIILHDPWNGKRFTLTRRRFQTRWHGYDTNKRRQRWVMAISPNDFEMGRQYKPTNH